MIKYRCNLRLEHFLCINQLLSVIFIFQIPMTPRCIAKLRPMKQRANLFAGD